MRQIDMQEAVAHLQKGGLLVYPTETFFGIGCKISDENAIANVFRVKRRLFAMPLPVILANKDQLLQIAQMPACLDADVALLAELFWPGPLTLILPARIHLSPLLTGGTGHIAARISPHPVAAELARQLGEPLVSSSANISGQPAVTQARALAPELVEAVGAVLDIPPAPAGGNPSTIVEPLGQKHLRLHRSGAIPEHRLQQAGFLLEEHP